MKQFQSKEKNIINRIQFAKNLPGGRHFNKSPSLHKWGHMIHLFFGRLWCQLWSHLFSHYFYFAAGDTASAVAAAFHAGPDLLLQHKICTHGGTNWVNRKLLSSYNSSVNEENNISWKAASVFKSWLIYGDFFDKGWLIVYGLYIISS